MINSFKNASPPSSIITTGPHSTSPEHSTPTPETPPYRTHRCSTPNRQLSKSRSPPYPAPESTCSQSLSSEPHHLSVSLDHPSKTADSIISLQIMCSNRNICCPEYQATSRYSLYNKNPLCAMTFCRRFCRRDSNRGVQLLWGKSLGRPYSSRWVRWVRRVYKKVWNPTPKPASRT